MIQMHPLIDKIFPRSAMMAGRGFIAIYDRMCYTVFWIYIRTGHKEIRLTPEEAVRQLYIYNLVQNCGYSTDQMELEHRIHFGGEVGRADIVIFEKTRPNVEYVVIEVKKPKLSDGKE